LDLVATPHNGLPHFQPDRFGFDNLVGAVDFGEVLSFDG
jgi:hypothetical protein